MTIAEVSKKFDISADTLRYYERIGLIPRVNRSASGIRDFTEMTAAGSSLLNVCAGLDFPLRP